MSDAPKKGDVLVMVGTKKGGFLFWSDPARKDWQPGGGGLMVHTILVDPQDPNRIYVAISAAGTYRSDGGNRVVPEERMTVWRSRNRGEKWEPLTQGLPDNAHLTVLREAMAVDSAESCGVYVGTETGQLFFSPNEGDRWELMADMLPPKVRSRTESRSGSRAILRAGLAAGFGQNPLELHPVLIGELGAEDKEHVLVVALLRAATEIIGTGDQQFAVYHDHLMMH
jgi:hypothetical protein